MTHWLAQHYLDHTYRCFPDHISISYHNRRLTYRDLYQRSNRLAHCLKRSGVQRQDRVAFCLPRSKECIISILGILKADAIYVPIDSKSPVNRWKHIIEDCEPRAIICDNSTISALKKIPAVKNDHILLVDDRNSLLYTSSGKPQANDPEYLDLADVSCPEYHNIDTDLAYILYTSGTTGQPKGCMISHLNIANYIDWATSYFSISDSDRILCTAPFHFDMSTFDIYCSMKSGAMLCIASEKDLLFPNALIDLIENEHVTIWKAISSLIMYLAKTKAITPGRMASLTRILFGGEVLSTRYLHQWMQAYPEKEFYNVYGPTEATGISLYHHITEIPHDQSKPIPIGRPCTNTEVLLLNEDQQPAGLGELAELYIRGSCLSRGYWRDPEKTNSVFFQNPLTGSPNDRVYKTNDMVRLRPDGLYDYSGRTDCQIKHLGYRIELEEIESALMNIQEISDAATGLIDSDLSDIPELAAFVEFADEIESSVIRSKLKPILPAYMIPTIYIPVSSIPRNRRGKIDRCALKSIVSPPLHST